MKALPIITLALCAAFLLFQQRSVSSEAKAVTALEIRLGEAKSSGAVPLRGGRGAVTAGASTGKAGAGATGAGLPESVAEIDLQDLAEAIRAAETGGLPNMKVMMKIQALLLQATPEELADLIRRTAELDAPDEVKQTLIAQFVGGLAEHDPQAALELAFASEHLDLDRQRWQIVECFSKWTSKDPLAATAWFDRELAKGSFDSKSLANTQVEAHLEFETAAVNALLESNPSLVRERLLALTEDERRTVLSGGHRFRLDLDNAAAHAELVRETVPADQQAGVLTDAARDLLGRHSYDDLVTYVETVGATPAEREQIVAAAVERQFQRFGWERQTPTSEDVAEMRSFLQQQTPESADRLTGQALANFGGAGDTFPKAVDLLVELHEAAPNDAALIGFLQAPNVHGNSAHDEARRELANRITDPARRQEILDNLK